MDVLKKIDFLRKQNGWTIYKLAEESGITQSTLANMFARKSTPSISTLSQICKAFDITLSDFFKEENFETKSQEKTFLNKFAKLNEQNKKYIIKFIDIMNND